MATSECVYERGPWEELDNGLEAACVPAPKGEDTAVRKAMGLQMVSMRLQPDLVSALKQIAQYHGIGYQPMIRDLLNRFAASEIKQILQDQMLRASEREMEEETVPVSQFLERERKMA